MGRTKRQRKLDERRQRERQREIDRRIAAGQTPVLLFHQTGTKTRPGRVSMGELVDLDSDDAKRLRKAREVLGLPPLDMPNHVVK